jgi:hypothetical protein
MECDFAITLPYDLYFKTDGWTTFQPRGSSSTIEDFSKKYSRTLKNYSKRLQDYSNYYSQLQRARGLIGHTPRVRIQRRMKADSY